MILLAIGIPLVYAIGAFLTAGCIYEYWMDKPYAGSWGEKGVGMYDTRWFLLIGAATIWPGFLIALLGRKMLGEIMGLYE